MPCNTRRIDIISLQQLPSLWLWERIVPHHTFGRNGLCFPAQLRRTCCSEFSSPRSVTHNFLIRIEVSSVSCKSNISHTLLNRRQSQAFAVVLCSNWFGPARPSARVIVHGILQAFHGENICTSWSSCHYGKTMHQTINHINHQHHQLFFGRIPMIFVSIEKFAAIYNLTWPPWYFHLSCWSQSIQLVWLCLCWQKWLVWTKLNASQYDNDLQSCSIFTTATALCSLQLAVHLGAPNDPPMNAPCTKVLKILVTQVSEKHANYDELMINSHKVCMLSKHIQTYLNHYIILHHITS